MPFSALFLKTDANSTCERRQMVWASVSSDRWHCTYSDVMKCKCWAVSCTSVKGEGALLQPDFLQNDIWDYSEYCVAPWRQQVSVLFFYVNGLLWTLIKTLINLIISRWCLVGGIIFVIHWGVLLVSRWPLCFMFATGLSWDIQFFKIQGWETFITLLLTIFQWS